jgi:hypothetical protein
MHSEVKRNCNEKKRRNSNGKSDLINEFYLLCFEKREGGGKMENESVEKRTNASKVNSISLFPALLHNSKKCKYLKCIKFLSRTQKANT